MPDGSGPARPARRPCDCGRQAATPAAVPRASAPADGRLRRSAENNSAPWRITQLATAHSDVPELGRAARVRHDASAAPVDVRGDDGPAGGRNPFVRLAHQPGGTLSGARGWRCASRTASIIASRRSRRARNVAEPAFRRVAKSGRRAARTMRRAASGLLEIGRHRSQGRGRVGHESCGSRPLKSLGTCQIYHELSARQPVAQQRTDSEFRVLREVCRSRRRVADVHKDCLMTMLDRMRRHKGWLKWSLGLVVLTFIVFYIPDFLDDPTDHRRGRASPRRGRRRSRGHERHRRRLPAALPAARCRPYRHSVRRQR